MNKKGMTQGAFAFEAGEMDEGTLRNLLKTGRASKPTWVRLAAAMGITVEQLLR